MTIDSFKKLVIWRAGRSIAVSTLLVALPAAARQGAPPLSQQRAVGPLPAVPQLVLPPVDVQRELAADRAGAGRTPLRFAVPSAVAVTPATHGTWEQLPDGRLWRLRLVSPGATDLNLGFTTFWLPEGATLHVCSESDAYFQGPYTPRDNKPHGQLWTPVLPGESAFIELFVPAQAKGEPSIVLSQVGLGYRDLFHRQKDVITPAAGSCEIDVVCPQAAAWSNEIRSVARYSISGTTLCTGTLIADVARDLQNYFLTANHCGLSAGNAASVVVYWNYQSPTCGQLGGGSLAHNQSGATFRAAKSDVDFALMELDDIPDSSFNVYYSGWDRSGAGPPGAVGIHHPDGGEKAISFSTTPLVTVNSCIASGGSATHWRVVWSAGVTEPGSSGSGIWDATGHRLVGTLSGGSSTCTASTSPDCYGKFSVAWAGGTSAATRLRDWLDPQNTGATSVPGLDPGLVPIVATAGASVLEEDCQPTNGAIDPGETVTVNFALKNIGRVGTANLMASLQATGGVMFPSDAQSFGALSGGGAAVARPFTFTAGGSCGGKLAPVLRLQDGTNDLGQVMFSLTLGKPTVALSQDFEGVVAPAIPAGWTTSFSGAGSAWATTIAPSDPPSSAAFAGDIDAVSDNLLTSPSLVLNSSDAQLTFRHSYNLEAGAGSIGFDGGVLEISINHGTFTDILSAGGSFVDHGYDRTISTRYQNPLVGRAAWSGDSGGFVNTTVNLPALAAGTPIQLRWRLGCDRSRSAIGWYVDTILVFDGYTCCRPLATPLIVNPRRVGPNIVFSYNSVIGQSYFLEASTNVTNGTWTQLGSDLGDGGVKAYTNTTSGAQERFFRLRTQ